MPQPNYGFIYIKTNSEYIYYFKGGFTECPERRLHDGLSEHLYKSQYETLYKITKNTSGVKLVDRIIFECSKNKSSPFNILTPYLLCEGGGTEFIHNDGKDAFKKCIEELRHVGIDTIELSAEEVAEYNTKHIDVILSEDAIRDSSIIACLIFDKPTDTQIVPRPYQIEIIEKSLLYFKTNKKGILSLICGVGKTLISLWITKQLKCNKIIIGVPNILLLNQWKRVIKELFKDYTILTISGNIKIDTIQIFLQKNINKCIVLTTYASSNKILTASNNIKYTFNMKINDETHHLTSEYINEDIKERRAYIHMLKIDSEYQLSLTATLKILGKIVNRETVISNDNEDYFGQIIDKRSLLWAIHENIVCDYVIQCITTNENDLIDKLTKFNITEDNDKRLFLSACVALKSLYEGHTHHLLIYTNDTPNSNKIIEYIKKLIDDKYFIIDDLYFHNYDSTLKPHIQTEIITQFKNASRAIISCVYCLGEGWDFPLLNGVVFAENMSSNIRIVQSALRASRKDTGNDAKISKIILPILIKDDLWTDKISDLEKVREVIYQLGSEDENIYEKIKLFKLSLQPNNPHTQKHKSNIDIGDYDAEFTKLLRLHTTERFTREESYNTIKKIIAEQNIKNKEEYSDACKKDVRLPDNPEKHFGYPINWIDYLSIQQHNYYNLTECKENVSRYLIKYPELKINSLKLDFISNTLCTLDIKFPPYGLWVEFYKIKDISEIIVIKTKKLISL